MNLRKFYIGKTIGLIIVLILAGIVYFFFGRNIMSLSPLTITTTTGNYGVFIDNIDSGYFSTTDENVKKIVRAYLTKPEAKTDSDKYDSSLVFYYTKNVFIAAELYSSTDRSSVSAFIMHDMKTGKPIADCNILAQAGLYKDNDLLLSATYKDNGIQGVCLYERGTPNFKFIDLTPQLSSTETLFADPAGQDLRAMINHVDEQKRTFLIDVYDNTIKNASGAVVPGYKYKRSIEVSY